MWSNSDGDDDDDDDDNDHRDQKLEHDADDDVEHMLQSNAHPDIREGGPGAMVFGRRWKWLTVDKIPLITASQLRSLTRCSLHCGRYGGGEVVVVHFTCFLVCFRLFSFVIVCYFSFLVVAFE